MTENLTLIDTEKLSNYEDGSWTKLAIETIQTCPKIKKERELEILCDRFGIGVNAKTLQAIGNRYSLTRERIRQIVNNSLKKVQKHCIGKDLKKRICEIERIIEKNGGFLPAQKIYDLLRIEEPQEQRAAYFVAFLSVKLILQKETNYLRQGWSQKKIRTLEIKEISKKATDLLKDEGRVLSAKKIAGFIKSEELLVTSVLAATKTLMTDEDGKWGLAKWPEVNPRSIRDKSKFLFKKHEKPMHYSELTEKIGKMDSKNVTKQSVHNELIKNSDFVLIGRGIYALSEWGYKPGVVEEVIVEVLTEAKEPLHKNEIIKRVLEKRIVKVSTVVLNLQKKRFKRVSKAIYTLN